MSQLLPCAHCSRHHRVCERVCPFCGGALPGCEAASETTRRGRMNRAMLVAAGAALLGTAECQTTVIPPYGIPPHPQTPDASTDAGDVGNAGIASDTNAHNTGNSVPDGADVGEGDAK